MSYVDFTIGFWHPFGPHSHESPERIIGRKCEEIYINGWTLWSFQHRLPGSLAGWHARLLEADGRPVFVLCSDSPVATDPAGDNKHIVAECKWYRPVDQTDWQRCPDAVHVPHAFRAKTKREVSAFIVQRIISPGAPFPLPSVEWLSKEGQWRQDRLPGQGEYLIRAGGSQQVRPVRAVLELKYPYLAVVSADPPQSEAPTPDEPKLQKPHGHDGQPVDSEYIKFWGPIRSAPGGLFAGEPAGGPWISRCVRGIILHLEVHGRACSVDLKFEKGGRIQRRENVLKLLAAPEGSYKLHDTPKVAIVRFPVLDKGLKDHGHWDEMREKLTELGGKIYKALSESDV